MWKQDIPRPRPRTQSAYPLFCPVSHVHVNRKHQNTAATFCLLRQELLTATGLALRTTFIMTFTHWNSNMAQAHFPNTSEWEGDERTGHKRILINSFLFPRRMLRFSHALLQPSTPDQEKKQTHRHIRGEAVHTCRHCALLWFFGVKPKKTASTSRLFCAMGTHTVGTFLSMEEILSAQVSSDWL